jgi:hypothetical protein
MIIFIVIHPALPTDRVLKEQLEPGLSSPGHSLLRPAIVSLWRGLALCGRPVARRLKVAS